MKAFLTARKLKLHGLGQWGVATNAGILPHALNNNEVNPAMAALLPGLGNDGRRKRLKLKPQTFNHHNPRQRVRPDPSSGTCAADKKL
ncbi:hypothetical protein GJU39_23080 [Pedobacter petrophilus]|uniref:Uncharacterized protein n=1 Tax=Pedobacter petrophilus TaxID=1908241 RepID=A0A7K0G5M0_9SPHI|nr:hypothetical protein [Pedobacter petrophilus]MRX78951.1 hypothetical protein [Pedobacter petrophilus]